MKRLLAVTAVFALGFLAGLCFRVNSPTALAGVEKCAAKNGDVNADGTVNLSDAVTILGNLFLGSPTELVPLCAPPAAVKGLPVTGQTKCYADLEGQWVEAPCESAICSGQDGFYRAGCPSEGRFTDNGDSTVTDHCTGLMWQRDTADVNGDGQALGDGSDSVSWCDALAYCENLTFAGHDDWRLPNVSELQSIVDYGRNSPAIDPVFGAVLGWYWSSSSITGNPILAWDINFQVGGVDSDDDKMNHDSVRAVRNAP